MSNKSCCVAFTSVLGVPSPHVDAPSSTQNSRYSPCVVLPLWQSMVKNRVLGRVAVHGELIRAQVLNEFHSTWRQRVKVSARAIG